MSCRQRCGLGLRLGESVHAPYYALFLLEPRANLIDLWWQARRSVTASVSKPA